jgi:four helix bundle protein
MIAALPRTVGAGRSPENLVAWQLCEELADLVCAMTATGPVLRDFNFCDQIRRSSGGPGPNIAEGFGRFTPREFAHYLRMAVSSLMETRTFLLRGQRLGYWKPDAGAAALSLCDRALDITRKLLASKLRQIDEEQGRKRPRARRPSKR